MLFGRAAERAQIAGLLEAARASRSSALLLMGEPGVGKTALLDDAREQAAGMHVLVARGVKSEAELPFAALHQLIRPSLELIDALPAPQANALRSALGLGDGAAGAQQRFLIYSACLSLLSELAEERPVLVLIDDAHWLDAPSAEAFLFVARRLDSEGIALLLAAREGELRPEEAEGVQTLAVEGLDDEAAAALLDTAATNAAPAVRTRLVLQTRGNPLALVELPAALSEAQLLGHEPLDATLPMTSQLESVFHERAGRLPSETRQLLLLAAADDSEETAVIHRAGAQLGVEPAALDAAERAGLVAIHGNRLDFRHPLVRSAVYGTATESERRAAHRALADSLAGDEAHADRCAWHLAAATIGQEEGAVGALEQAAARAEDRGGPLAAARALRRAAELSSDPARRGGQLTRAAWLTSLAGRDDQATALARQAAPFVADPQLRARLAEVQGLASIRSGRPHDAVGPLLSAARETADDAPATALGLLMLASSAAWNGGDREAYAAIARFARELEVPSADTRSKFIRRALTAYAAMIEGDTETGSDLLRETIAWGGSSEEPLLVYWSAWGTLWLGDDAEFDHLVGRAAELARARGEIGTLTYALGTLAAQLALRQRFDDALVPATEALGFARELAAVNLELIPRGAIAIVAAVRGQDAEARSHAEATLAAATANGTPLRASFAVYALALLDLGHSRWEEAHARLDAHLQGQAGALDPSTADMLPDAVEAAVRAGRRRRAEEALAMLEEWALRAPPAALVRLSSARALLSEGANATAHHEAALEQRADALPFDLARAQLLYGEHLRRERRRVDARAALREALESFERLGAEPWAERARTELRATGEIARKREDGAPDRLTPQELQVARLVAEGRSNKEVAAQLFLSPRTIDAHLRSVFSKLGISSRTQLARLPLGSDDATTEA
jgi:DNA-binding CsgD family transcriptional regulator